MDDDRRAALRLNQAWAEEAPNRFRSSPSGLLHVCHVDTCTFYYHTQDDASTRVCAISGRALEHHASKRSRQQQ